MNPKLFAQAIVSIEQIYGLRLDAQYVWLRLDKFKKVKELAGGKCNESKGWYGLKGACKRGKKGEGEVKSKESKLTIASKIRDRKGMGAKKQVSPAKPKTESPKTVLQQKTPQFEQKQKTSKEVRRITATDLIVPGSPRLDYSKISPKLDALAKSGVTMLMRDRADRRPEDVYKTNSPGKAEQSAFEINHYLSPPVESSKSELNKFRKGDKIKILESFESVFNDAVKAYDSSTGEQNLTPIYQVRRALGDRLTRGEFDQFMEGLVRQKKITLTGASVEDSADDKMMDSMATSVNGVRTLVKIRQ